MSKSKIFTRGERTAVLLLTGTMSLLFGFFCYLSLNFLSLGETAPSIILAAIFACLLGGFAWGAIRLKKANRRFKTCLIWEWVCLILFVTGAIFAIFPFSHFFAVLERKSEIQKTVIVNIMRAENLFADYDKYANNRLDIYKRKLKGIVRGKRVNPTKYHRYGFISGMDDDTQVENKMFILRAQLYPSNYEEMKRVGTKWFASSKAIMASWKPIGIVVVMNEVEKNLTLWKNQLTGFSAFRAQGETASNFDYTLTFDDATNKITKLGRPVIHSVAIALVLYALIILPYFINKRSTKNHYSLGGKKKSKKSGIDIKY